MQQLTGSDPQDPAVKRTAQERIRQPVDAAGHWRAPGKGHGHSDGLSGKSRSGRRWKQMRHIVIALLLTLFVVVVSAGAQDYPAGEVFAGFSLVDGDSPNLYGWQASGASNITEQIGMVADFGGQYDSVGGVDVSSHQFMAGPRVRTRPSRWMGFGHALFGLHRVGVSGFGADNGFGMGLGGGVDLMTSRRFGIRVFQLDWLPVRNAGDWTTDQYRAGFGVILPFGS